MAPGRRVSGPLETRLAEIRAGAVDRIPPEVRELMQRATTELRASGLAERALGPGDRAPRFARPDLAGRTVRLGALLRDGPVVVSFFRGRW